MIDRAYIENAKKWYQTMYVDPVSEKLPYLILFCLSCLNLFTIEKIISSQMKTQVLQPQVVMQINYKKPSDRIILTKLRKKGMNIQEAILKDIIQKYVYNYESLLYEGRGNDAIEKKANILKKFSSNEVYNKYLENAYSKKPDSDLSFGLNNDKKIANIHYIEFIKAKQTPWQKFMSKITTQEVSNDVRVYFTINTSKDTNTQEVYADISYYFELDNISKEKKIIFNVTSYETHKL